METVIRFNFEDSHGGKPQGGFNRFISEALMIVRPESVQFYLDGEEKQIVGKLEISTFESSLPDRESEERTDSDTGSEDQDGVSGD